VLGGVRVPYHVGLEGHSDADVLAHAVADALLGAAGQGDIGQLFPSEDPAFEGADSLQLLAGVAARVRAAGYEVGNVDAVIVCEAPRLAPHLATMARNLARSMGVDEGRASVKATTTEGMGYEGRREGISATAVCLLQRAQSRD
jgi:2-C-methyl-D-erythritol 2,4-cyclodiphosphate synthase